VLQDGPFWDVEFYTNLEKMLPANCRHMAFFDSCMSGTMSNLPWLFNILSKSFNQSSILFSAPAVCHAISGCQNSQTSSAGYGDTGLSALTGAYMEYMKDQGYKNVSLPDLMVQLRIKMSKHGELQIPMWTSNRNDVNWSVA